MHALIRFSRFCVIRTMVIPVLRRRKTEAQRCYVTRAEPSPQVLIPVLTTNREPNRAGNITYPQGGCRWWQKPWERKARPDGIPHGAARNQPSTWAIYTRQGRSDGAFPSVNTSRISVIKRTDTISTKRSDRFHFLRPHTVRVP